MHTLNFNEKLNKDVTYLKYRMPFFNPIREQVTLLRLFSYCHKLSRFIGIISFCLTEITGTSLIPHSFCSYTNFISSISQPMISSFLCLQLVYLQVIRLHN